MSIAFPGASRPRFRFSCQRKREMAVIPNTMLPETRVTKTSRSIVVRRIPRRSGAGEEHGGRLTRYKGGQMTRYRQLRASGLGNVD
jgi:hypothetical protein